MPGKKLNFTFWGTPEAASETLEILKENGYSPSLIVTAPDTKKGRGLCLQASPVALFAEKNNIPCLKPGKPDEKMSRSDLFEFSSSDLNIVVAYGKIIPEDILNLPKWGSINVHYSLLPKYRGASPVESAILNGENETGVTIQKMAYKMDTGYILAQEKVAILADEKAPELRKRLTKIGAALLVKILPDFIDGKITPVPQNENEATYCRKIKKEDGFVSQEELAEALLPQSQCGSKAVVGAKLPWELSSHNLYNKFRAYAGWPRTFFFNNDKRIIITDATLENGKFTIKKIIPEGKKEMSFSELAEKTNQNL